MTSPTTDRRLGLVGNTAFKAPVTVLAASNITQSGEQTIDGVAVLESNAAGAPDRVLCVGQTDTTTNGIWDVSTSSWTRSHDADGRYDLAKGTNVLVTSGTTYSGTFWQVTSANPITIGTTAMTWTRSLANSATTVSFIQAGTGAVTRTMQDKGRESVSVKDFGVVGDGVTTDTAAIQAAATAAAGGTLHFPAGTYMTGKITLPSNIVLSGDGEATTIKLLAAQNDHLLYSTAKSGITIRSLVLDGNKANQTSGAVARCYYALDTSDIRLEDVVVKNAADHGFHVSIGATTDPLSDSSRVWATRCKFIDNGTVIGANGGTGMAVTAKYLWATDCYSEGNILSGFKFTGSYVSAKGCYAIDNDCGGFTTGFDTVTEEGSVHVYGGCYALHNGNGTDGGDGWRHQGQVDQIIHRDCFAIGNKWAGISMVASSATKPTDVLIEGGAILDNGQSFTPAATVGGAGVFLASTVSSPDVPTTVSLENVKITDTRSGGSKTQTYGVEIQEGDDVFIGSNVDLSGNLTQSIYNAATVTNTIRLSPQIKAGDFIARSNTPASVTGTVAETDLQTLTIPANTLGVGQRFRVRARGTISGTNGAKSIRLYFGNANSLVSSQAAGDTQAWFVDGVLEVAAAGDQRLSAIGAEVGGQTAYVVLASSTNVNAALVCKVTGTLGNTADTITCSSFYFEPLY